MTASIVCIGVSDYPKHGLLAGEEKLEFAADSARSLSFLFPRFFSKAQTTLVLNENANIDDVHAVFSEVGKKSELEHFVLYFAGHAEAQAFYYLPRIPAKLCQVKTWLNHFQK